jgi:hypothetical protein
MSADPLVLDPEFEALLREVALDPDSTLLRVPRPKVVRGLFEREDVVRPHETGLTLAERHLVQVHNNQLAWMLRQACLYKLLEDSSKRYFVSRHGPSGEDRSPLRPSAIAALVKDDQDNNPDAGSHSNAIELLLRWVRQPLSAEPTVADLAAVSHRLQPTNQTRLLFAADMCCRDAPRTCLQLATFVLGAHPTPEQATRAWECIGLAHAKMGHLKQAHHAYRIGCAIPDQHTFMNRFEFALQVGDRSDALESSRRLEELVPGDPPSLAWFIEARLRRRVAGEWAPTQLARALATSLVDEIGGAAQRIAHVYL